MNRAAVLVTRRLRALTTSAPPDINPTHHLIPPGRPKGGTQSAEDESAHVSAASGLVCHAGRAYVVADDEQHLAVFSDATTPGRRFRMLAGALPAAAAARKRRKADLESLLLLPALPGQDTRRLLALGSGALPQRSVGAVITLGVTGLPLAAAQRVDLAALHEPLRQRLGPINLEGALLAGSQLLLLNRGAAGGAGNAVLRYTQRDLADVLAGTRSAVPPRAVLPVDLGYLGDVPLGFTDGAALPGGGFLFSAAAEDAADSVADGPCSGSVVGCCNAAGQVLWTRALDVRAKVEGLAVRAGRSGRSRVALCLVTDADDPQHAASMLLAWL